jgi:hypothetical protein
MLGSTPRGASRPSAAPTRLRLPCLQRPLYGPIDELPCPLVGCLRGRFDLLDDVGEAASTASGNEKDVRAFSGCGPCPQTVIYGARYSCDIWSRARALLSRGETQLSLLFRPGLGLRKPSPSSVEGLLSRVPMRGRDAMRVQPRGGTRRAEYFRHHVVQTDPRRRPRQPRPKRMPLRKER